MSAVRQILSRCRALFGGRQSHVRLDEEIESHIEHLTADYQRRGLTAEAARIEARRAFGGLSQTREAYRDQRVFQGLDRLLQDVRHSLRMARRNLSFTAAAVGTLALGFGATLSIFGIVDAVLLRPLPVTRPAELVSLSGNFSFQAFRSLAGDPAVGVALAATGGLDRVDAETTPGSVEALNVSSVSGGYFSVLGVAPALGSVFNPSHDAVPGQPAIAVLSDAYWRRRFGSDKAVVGRVIRVSGKPLTIVGVAPRAFTGERVGSLPDLWVPVTMRSAIVPGRDLLASPTTSWLDVVGRLSPGANVDAVGSGLTIRYRRILQSIFGSPLPVDVQRDIDETVVTLAPAARGLSSLRDRFQEPLVVLMAVVVLILLLACANVANLLLARATTRRREIALRLALGVSKGRLVRQLLTESALLAGLGAAGGIAIAWPVREMLLRLTSADGSRVPIVVGFDERTMVFLLAAVSVTTLLFGLAPALRAVRGNDAALLQSARGSRQRLSGFTLNSGILIFQVAVSMVLLIGAGLFVRTLANLRNVDLGFVPEGRVVVDVDPRSAGYSGKAYAALNQRLLQRLATVPGVEAVTLSENGLLAGRESSTDRFGPLGFMNPGELPKARFDVVGPGYLDAVGISIVAGRDVDSRDRIGSPRIVVINQALARRLFGSENVVGRRIDWGGMLLDIAGVAGDVNYEGPRDEAQPRFYLPYFQHPDRAELASTRFVVRVSGDVRASLRSLEAAVHDEDARVPVTSVRPATDLFERQLVQERLLVRVSSAFGFLALALTCIGLYGLLAYRVAERTNEIGVRRALGAPRRSVLALVLRHDLLLVVAGIAIGVPIAIALSGLATSLYFGVDGSDPVTLAGSALGVAGVGLLAALVPMRRALSIEPVTALRQD